MTYSVVFSQLGIINPSYNSILARRGEICKMISKAVEKCNISYDEND